MAAAPTPPGDTKGGAGQGGAGRRVAATQLPSGGLASAHTALRGKIGGLLKVAVYASASGPRGKDPPHIGDNLVAPWREDIVWYEWISGISCF